MSLPDPVRIALLSVFIAYTVLWFVNQARYWWAVRREQFRRRAPSNVVSFERRRA